MSLIAYLDCFAGISGDMLLGALVDAGWSVDRLRDVVSRLKLENVYIDAEPVTKQSISGTQITVRIPPEQPHRGFNELAAIVHQADLPDQVRQQALSALRLLAETESAVHRVPFEQVH